MLRKASTGIIAIILIGLLVLIAAASTGLLNEQLTAVRFRLSEDKYTEAAERVVREQSRGAVEGHFVYHPVDGPARLLVSAPYLYYVQHQGGDYVYFALFDVVTMSDGLMYSKSGAPPPAHSEIETLRRLNSNWFIVAFNNGVLEYGSLDQGLEP